MKKEQYLEVILTDENFKLYKNNYVKIWKGIKVDLNRWERLDFSLMGRILVIKMNVLTRMLFLVQTIPILIKDIFLAEKYI